MTFSNEGLRDLEASTNAVERHLAGELIAQRNLTHALELQLSEERERCAKIVEEMQFDFDFSWERGHMAAEIRRGPEKRSNEPLYLCKNCGRHHWEGPKDCPV